MTMRPFTDNRGGLNHLVDAQIGRAFPVVHKVYQHLDTIEYVAKIYEAGRSRDIVLRTNRTKEWVEWQYKGEAKWTILFKFSDLLGADIADVVAAEQAIAAELKQLRLQLSNDTKITLAARDVAIAARTGAEAAQAASVTARDAAQASRGAAAQSALTAGQHAQDLAAAKTAAQQSATQAAADRTLANQAAQTAQSQATAAGASATSAAEARQAAAASAAEANAAKSATALLQSAADQSAQAAGQSQAAALGSANAAAVSATAAGVSAQTAATHQAAAEAAVATGAQHLADATDAANTTTAQLAQVTALHGATGAFAQAAQASADQADTAATSAGVSASDALQLRNETQGFHDAASAMVADAAQVSADRATVQSLAQKVQLAADQAQSNALAAAGSAGTAVASANAAANSATTAQTSASEVLGQVTAITGRLAEADSIVSTVTTLRDQTLSYKEAAQNSTTNAQAVAADRAAVAAMMGTIAANAASAADSKDQALAAAATAAQAEAAANTAVTVVQDAAQAVAQAVANITSDAQSAATRAEAAATQAESAKQSAETAASTATTAAAKVAGQLGIVNTQATTVSGLRDQVQQLHDQTLAYKNTAQATIADAQAVADDRAAVADMLVDMQANAAAAQAAQLAAESAATLATDANAGALAALTNHTAAADPHTQYLTKAAATGALAAKVDKVAGKQLSTEDYTAEEKFKLAGIVAGANAYAHPTNHPASIITQDASNRFVTDAEKTAWNAKQAALISGTNLKTINGESLLGGGDLVVTGSGGGGGGPTLQGDTAPYATQTKTYQITNYSSFSTYDVSASAGTASIADDTITFTAPASAGNVSLTLTVDGQPTVFVVDVQAASVAEPANTSPANGAINIGAVPILQSSAFAAYGRADTHLASRWTLYQGGTQVHSSGWRTDALTSYAVPAGVVAASTAYTWTVEHRGNALGNSPASTATGFTTAASFNSYIATPSATPANFGDALEGGFYVGMVWGQLTQSSTSMAIATGSKTFTVPSMTSAPIVYGGQMVEVRSRANPANKLVGTVTGAAGTNLTINVTSIGGSGTFSDWSVMARHRIIVAPKASGEHAGIALKNTNTALPTACQTLTEGFAATQAMRDADTSAVYPAAHWARNLNIGGRTDWYIPARDELELCWRNLKPVTDYNYVAANRATTASFNYANNGSYGDIAATHGTNNNSSPTGAAYTASVPAQTAATAFRTGGVETYEFGSSYYWSSSDFSATSVWLQSWYSSYPGYQSGSGKSAPYRVRAVRRSVI